MSKRRQPPSPAVESPLAAVTSKPAPGKRQDQRPSPAAQRAAAAAEVQGQPADPLPSDAHAAAKQLSEHQQKFLTGFGIDGSPLPSTPDGKKKKELDSSPPGSGSGSGSDAGSAQKKDGKKKRSSSGGSRQELTGLRGGGR